MKTKRIFLILLFTLVLCVVNAQNAYQHDWAFSLPSDNNELAYDIAVASDGSFYVMGEFFDSLDLDPSIGTSIVGTQGGYNNFLVKYDSNGNLIWHRTFDTDKIYDIELDNQDNVYLIGEHTGLTDFDPNPSDTFTLPSWGCFLLKINVTGDFQWVRGVKVAGNGVDNGLYDLTVDPNNNVHIVGDWTGDLILFDEVNLGDTLIHKSYRADGFLQSYGYILSYSEHGNFLNQYYLEGKVVFRSIESDHLSNLYASGSFFGTVDFDPGTSTTNITAYTSGSHTPSQTFVTKINSSKTHLWTRAFTTTNYSHPIATKVDNLGNVYTVGNYKFGWINLNPVVSSTGPFFKPGYCTRNVFLSKLDSNGNYLWGKTITEDTSVALPATDVFARDLALDSNGNVFVTGNFSGSIEFDSGSGSHSISYYPAKHAFTSIFSHSGTLADVFTVQSDEACKSFGISISNNHDVYTTGHIKGSCNFRPSGTPYILTSEIHSYYKRPSPDVYVQKLTPLTLPFPGSGQRQNSNHFSSSFALYPNPTTGIFNIQTDWEGTLEVKIADGLGRTVLNQYITESRNSLDLTDQEPGVYTVIVTNGADSKVIKLVLAK